MVYLPKNLRKLDYFAIVLGNHFEKLRTLRFNLIYAEPLICEILLFFLLFSSIPNGYETRPELSYLRWIASLSIFIYNSGSGGPRIRASN